MWIKTKEGKLINLDRVDTIEINPINSIICKFENKGICLGNFETSEDAEEVFNVLQEVLKANELTEL